MKYKPGQIVQALDDMESVGKIVAIDRSDGERPYLVETIKNARTDDDWTESIRDSIRSIDRTHVDILEGCDVDKPIDIFWEPEHNLILERSQNLDLI